MYVSEKTQWSSFFYDFTYTQMYGTLNSFFISGNQKKFSHESKSDKMNSSILNLERDTLDQLFSFYKNAQFLYGWLEMERAKKSQFKVIFLYMLSK